MMRILVFCTADLRVPSGSSVRARLIVEGLVRCGAEVFLVSSGAPAAFTGLGIRHAALTPVVAWCGVVADVTEAFRPDVLFGITEAGADVLVKAAREIRRPVALDIHGIGVIEIVELGRRYAPLKGRLKKSLRWIARIPSADAITVANPTLYTLLRPFNRRTVPVIGMTDVSRFRPDGPAAPLGRDRSRIQVLYTGNYHKWQGVDLLVEAIRTLMGTDAPLEFTLIGSVGRNGHALARWKASMPGDAVHFLDTVDYDRVADYYRGADIIVIPRPFMASTWLAFPQKLVDAMASGRAVVATDLAPHRWGLGAPEAGVLCPPTAAGVAQGIRRAEDRGLRVRLAKNARRKAVERFCHLKQTGKIFALLCDLAARTAR